MKPLRKSIDILLHNPFATLPALPGYLLMMLLFAQGSSGISKLFLKLTIVVVFMLAESVLQPALSMHIKNILENTPEKPFFWEAVRKSKFRLLVSMLMIASMLLALYLVYLVVLTIVAISYSYSSLATFVFIANYILLPIPCLLAAGLYFSSLPLSAQSGISAGKILAASFHAFGRTWKKSVAALAAASFMMFAAYWSGQILYYLANDISLLYLIDNPVPLNYASALIMLACMPLYSWLICYFHCLQNPTNQPFR